MAEVADRKRFGLICLLLALITAWVYWPMTRYQFNNFDDDQYITSNPRVLAGLTSASVKWAFTSGYAANWHPLTWLSHMLDVQLYGLNAGAHHFTSLLFHVANTLLLFGLLLRLTVREWRSAFVAALFAWHPMHVESVAFVAERKDVLSAFFALWTLWVYWSYAQKPAWGRYCLALLLFALGLMAKPMLVTLPFLMLLLDYWPMDRCAGGPARENDNITAAPPQFGFGQLLLEKVPFFALTAASCCVTYFVQKKGGAMVLTHLTREDRLLNAINSYAVYLGQIFWPHNLAVLYPYAYGMSLARLVGEASLLAAISLLAIRAARSRPYWPVGWFWFLIALGPVIGLVQVGEQAMADRYTYLPSIGIFLLVTWEASRLLSMRPLGRIILGAAATVILAGCLTATSRQLRYWQDSITLFSRAAAVTKNNAVAYCDLGEALAATGQLKAAIEQFDQALEIRPNYYGVLNNRATTFRELGQTNNAIRDLKRALEIVPHWQLAENNLGLILFDQGKLAEAEAHFRASVADKPDSDTHLANLGLCLAQEGKLDEAIATYRKALAVAPNAFAENGLGRALEIQGKPAEAAAHYEAAVEIKPDLAEAYNNLGAVLSEQGKFEEAAVPLREALKFKPNYPDAEYNLGNAYLGLGNPAEAAAHYAAALRLQPDFAEAHFNLANALAAQKQWDAAVAHYSEAVRLRPDFAEAQVKLKIALRELGKKP